MTLLLFIKTSLAPWPTPKIDVESPKAKGLNAAVLVSLFSGARREDLPTLCFVWLSKVRLWQENGACTLGSALIQSMHPACGSSSAIAASFGSCQAVPLHPMVRRMNVKRGGNRHLVVFSHRSVPVCGYV